MNVRDRVLERAADQHGYITTRDAREIDVDPAQLRLMAARGRLERISRGVYRVPFLPRTEHDGLAEAVAWTLGRGVISHESALHLYGVSDVNPSHVHLTVPRDNHPRGRGGERYRLHRGSIDRSEITEHNGIPVTIAERTIRDCIRWGTDPRQVRQAIDDATAQGLIRRAVAAVLHEEVDSRTRRPRT